MILVFFSLIAKIFCLLFHSNTMCHFHLKWTDEPYITLGIFTAVYLSLYKYVWKSTSLEHEKHFSNIWKVLFRRRCFLDQSFVAILRFCGILGGMETQLVSSQWGGEPGGCWLPACCSNRQPLTGQEAKTNPSQACVLEGSCRQKTATVPDRSQSVRSRQPRGCCPSALICHTLASGGGAWLCACWCLHTLTPLTTQFVAFIPNSNFIRCSLAESTFLE